MQDRVSTYPGRVTLTPVSGEENTYTMSRADEPTQVGTPLNTANLLSAAAAAAVNAGTGTTPEVPSTAFEALANALSNKQNKLTFDSAPTSGSANPVTSGGVYTALSNVSYTTGRFQTKDGNGNPKDTNYSRWVKFGSALFVIVGDDSVMQGESWQTYTNFPSGRYTRVAFVSGNPFNLPTSDISRYGNDNKTVYYGPTLYSWGTGGAKYGQSGLNLLYDGTNTCLVWTWNVTINAGEEPSSHSSMATPYGIGLIIL